MNFRFSIPIEFVNDVSDDNAKEFSTRFIIDTIKQLQMLPGKFGPLPFDRCVVVEGVNQHINHGQQIDTKDLDTVISDWFWTIVELARSAIHYQSQKDCGSINVQMSDDDTTFGFRINVFVKDIGTTYRLIVMPNTDDICSDKQDPWTFTIYLNGDQRK